MKSLGSDEDYMWKDQRRQRKNNKHRAQQRYSWLGMLIAVTMGVAVGWMIWDVTVGHKEVRRQGSAEYEALRMQCENVGGLLATADGPQGTDVSCYDGEKKLWWVRL